MKWILVGLLCAGLGLAWVATKTYVDNSRADRDAAIVKSDADKSASCEEAATRSQFAWNVKRVMKEWEQVRLRATDEEKPAKRWPEFVLGLDRIFINGCPQDFKLAWFDYVQSCHRVNPVHTLIAPLIETAIALRSKSSEAGDAAVRDAKDSPPDYFAKVQRVALTYSDQ